MSKSIAAEIKLTREMLDDIRAIEEAILILGIKEKSPGKLSSKLKEVASSAVASLEEKLA